MRTNQTFSISFFIRKKKNQPDQALIYARVTVNGKKLEISLKRTIPVDRWNQNASRAIGNSAESFQINKKINETKSQLFRIHDALVEESELVTCDLVKSRFLGTDKTNMTLVDLLEYHDSEMEKVLKYGTLKNYRTTTVYLKSYLKIKYRKPDIYLKHINYRFTLGFESYLRSMDGLHNNGVMKHMERFKKVMRLAENLDWIEKNPTKRFKLRFDKVDMVYLSINELENLRTKELSNPTLRINRDIFIFACYTGLAYADVRALERNNMQIGVDGKKWIYTRRSKTNTPVRIPLLETAEEIIDRYEDHPKAIANGRLLPVYSNQKTNEYLKKLASKAKISKKLSFHAARHTFATTVTLSNGVPIETVSKLLGHTKIATTQIYARVLNKKLGEDMEILQRKLNNQISSDKPEEKKYSY